MLRGWTLAGSLRNAGHRPRRAITLLGVAIGAVRLSDVLERVSTAIARDGRLRVMYVNIHCMNVAARDPGYRRILNGADLVYCDGVGVRLGAWLAGRPLPARMTGADWIHDLARLAVRDGRSIFLLGGAPGVGERAATVLRVRHPGLTIVGALSGYEAGADAVAAIAAARPDILLVGMGTPTQERWIERHAPDLEVPVIWAVGALFDFVSGRLRRGPRLLTEHGCEWLCRLAVEPRKLWRRYLVGNPLFFLRVVRAYRSPRLRRRSRGPDAGAGPAGPGRR